MRAGWLAGGRAAERDVKELLPGVLTTALGTLCDSSLAQLSPGASAVRQANEAQDENKSGRLCAKLTMSVRARPSLRLLSYFYLFSSQYRNSL